MTKDVFPTLGDMPLAKVKPADVMALCDKVKARGSPKMALLTRNAVRRMYDFAIAPSSKLISIAPAGKKGQQQAQALGRSRGRLSTKIHATVDAQGQPTRVCLTDGQASDLDGADVLLPDNEERTLIADKGYDATQRVVALALRAAKTVVIPTIRDGRQQRNFDRSLYRLRHHIENFFARLKQWRGIATRYDKTARSFLGAIHLVCALHWLAAFTNTP